MSSTNGPKMNESLSYTVSIEDETVEAVEQYVQELSLPGRVFHMYYITARNTIWIYHLVDPDFLRAWLQHPHFHMIK